MDEPLQPMAVEGGQPLAHRLQPWAAASAGCASSPLRPELSSEEEWEEEAEEEAEEENGASQQDVFDLVWNTLSPVVQLSFADLFGLGAQQHSGKRRAGGAGPQQPPACGNPRCHRRRGALQPGGGGGADSAAAPAGQVKPKFSTSDGPCVRLLCTCQREQDVTKVRRRDAASRPSLPREACKKREVYDAPAVPTSCWLHEEPRRLDRAALPLLSH